MKETEIIHNKERKKKLVTVTSHLVLDENDLLLEGRTYKRYSSDFPYRNLNLEREAGIIALSNQLNLPAVRIFRCSVDEGVLETEYVPGENFAERLAHPFITKDEVRLLVINTLRCMESYHSAGIILIDTHPSNFIIREDNGECIFCDFGLAFSPLQYPFSVPPPTRCDRGYFSAEQNRAIGNDLAGFEVTQTSADIQSNNLQPVGDVFVYSSQLLSHFSHSNFDNDLLNILKKMKKEQYRSVSEILQDLDETTPLHLKGTPDAVPLEELDDLLAQNKALSQRPWLNSIQPYMLIISVVIVVPIILIIALTHGGISYKTTATTAQVSISPKTQTVSAIVQAPVPETKSPEVAPSQKKGDDTRPKNDPIPHPSVTKTAPISAIQTAKRDDFKKPENPNRNFISRASRLIKNPSHYDDGIAILASLASDPEATLLLSQELESARKNASSQRLSNNRKGIQALYALHSNKCLVSEKAGAAIEEFYDNSKSSGNIVNIIRLQLLATRNHAGAQFALGRIHEQAGVRKRNYATAYRYYTAAKAENADAGKAVERLEQSVVVNLMQSKDAATRKEAFRLLLAIAEVPANKEAQYTVGKIYQDGALGEKNNKLARAYLKLAARHGKEEAKKELARL